MQDIFQPLLPKVRLCALAVHVQQSGLCLGDPAELAWTGEGQVGVFALPRRRRFGLFAPRRAVCLGLLDPQAAAVVAPAMEAGEPLRVRIVGLHPEHLAGEGAAEIHVSVWGDARRVLRITPAAAAPFAAPPAFRGPAFRDPAFRDPAFRDPAFRDPDAPAGPQAPLTGRRG